MSGDRGRLQARLEAMDEAQIRNLLDFLEEGPEEGNPPPAVESSSPFGKKRDLEIVVRVSVTATTMDGQPFSEWPQKAVTYHQDGYALAVVHSKVRDFITAMVDLGFESAKLHGEGPQG
jgi:hypothetical protein